ncbi:hypothetical protein [Streptomyces sp. CA-253872]|uniref:hypothetical protein n=1 Tax=Streptomyces sp. CA-253872 TaxID=3240067 RepID=UPI003D9251F4
MKGFVEVVASPFPEGLLARSGTVSFRMRLSRAHSFRGARLVDEHLVVDVDDCRVASLPDCADVLLGSRALPVRGALRRLAALTSCHPACGIAAVPLAGAGGAGVRGGGALGANGWALTDGAGRPVVLVPPLHRLPCRGDAGARLLPSCVHAWVVAGRPLRAWPYACDVSSC